MARPHTCASSSSTVVGKRKEVCREATRRVRMDLMPTAALASAAVALGGGVPDGLLASSVARRDVLPPRDTGSAPSLSREPCCCSAASSGSPAERRVLVTVVCARRMTWPRPATPSDVRACRPSACDGFPRGSRLALPAPVILARVVSIVSSLRCAGSITVGSSSSSPPAPAAPNAMRAWPPPTRARVVASARSLRCVGTTTADSFSSSSSPVLGTPANCSVPCSRARRTRHGERAGRLATRRHSALKAARHRREAHLRPLGAQPWSDGRLGSRQAASLVHGPRRQRPPADHCARGRSAADSRWRLRPTNKTARLEPPRVEAPFVAPARTLTWLCRVRRLPEPGREGPRRFADPGRDGPVLFDMPPNRDCPGRPPPKSECPALLAAPPCDVANRPSRRTLLRSVAVLPAASWKSRALAVGSCGRPCRATQQCRVTWPPIQARDPSRSWPPPKQHV